MQNTGSSVIAPLIEKHYKVRRKDRNLPGWGSAVSLIVEDVINFEGFYFFIPLVEPLFFKKYVFFAAI